VGRKVELDPYIRINWHKVEMKTKEPSDLIDWCLSDAMKSRWTYIRYWSGMPAFYFKDKRDAALFKLTWS